MRMRMFILVEKLILGAMKPNKKTEKKFIPISQKLDCGKRGAAAHQCSSCFCPAGTQRRDRKLHPIVFFSYLPHSVQAETVPMSLGHPRFSPVQKTMPLEKRRQMQNYWKTDEIFIIVHLADACSCLEWNTANK